MIEDNTGWHGSGHAEMLAEKLLFEKLKCFGLVLQTKESIHPKASKSNA